MSKLEEFNHSLLQTAELTVLQDRWVNIS